MFAKIVVVDLKEVFVEIQPSISASLGQLRPIHDFQHPGKGDERGFDGILIGVIHQKLNRASDQRTRPLQRLDHRGESARQRYPLRPRHQQAEGDGLRVAIRESLIGRFRKKHVPPVVGESLEHRRIQFQLLGDFIPEQSTQARRHHGELLHAARRQRLPLQKIAEQGN